MTSANKRSVLIVEDDSDWRKEYRNRCKNRGWSTTEFNNVPQALRLVESGDVQFDIAIVDKGGSNASRGKPDIIGHRDGLTVLRCLKEYQPACIRVLSTGESWSHILFSDQLLQLHAFFDKGAGEYLHDLFVLLDGWEIAPLLERPVVIQMDYGSGKRIEGEPVRH
jgi:CheY-like chemotaxis protein